MDERVLSRTSSDGRFDQASDSLSWSAIRPRGKIPEPRCYHASAVIGRKMFVIGGDSGPRALNDVQLLHLGKLAWTELGNGSAAFGRDVKLKAGSAHSLPPCKGHSLISWGKIVLLVAGEISPAKGKVEVWSFDTESETWARVSVKGEVPVARSGQTVTRAGSILILFGGEDAKGRKLNDLHILDLKSLTWLPLNTKGDGPSPRARHAAAMYEDRFLLIFGGMSKSKFHNDIFSLDFESMEWCRLKTKGQIPGPRAGHAGVLIGDKWYIAGGDSNGQIETFVLDLLQSSWSVFATSTPYSVVANQGLSIQLVQRRERSFLVAFGGKGKELSNDVQVLFMLSPHQNLPTTPQGVPGQASAASTPDNARPSYSPLSASGLPCACVSVMESPSVLTLEGVSASGLSPLRKRFAQIQDSIAGNVEIMPLPTGLEGSFNQEGDVAEVSSHEVLFQSGGSFSESGERAVHVIESLSAADSGVNRGSWQSPAKGNAVPSRYVQPADCSLANVARSEPLENAEASDRSPEYAAEVALTGILGTGWSSKNSDYLLFDPLGGSQLASEFDVDVADELLHPDMERRKEAMKKLKQTHERKLAGALRKHAIIEGQLAAVAKGKEDAEKSLKAVVKHRQQVEEKLMAAFKEQHELKNKLEQAERALEDSNNLANVIHQENELLEREIAFSKGVLEDIQKELQTTREVLAGERSRAFQLQVEVFELKQKFQAFE